MRFTTIVALAAALGAPACKKKQGATDLQPKRIKGLLKQSDPLLAAGDLPLSFK